MQMPLGGTWGFLIEAFPNISFTLTLLDLQLDAQNSYLFTYNTSVKVLYMFRALPCSSSGGLRRNCICVCSLWYRHSLQVTVLCTG